MKIIALEEHTVDRAIGAATAEVCKGNVPYLDTFYRADMHQFGHCQILTLAEFKRIYL